MRSIVVLPILAYRKLISPLTASRCRYYPSCSSYAVDAVREFGPLKGLILTAWRILRCNPFSHGGIDRVSDQQIFKMKTGCRHEAKFPVITRPKAEGSRSLAIARDDSRVGGR